MRKAIAALATLVVLTACGSTGGHPPAASSPPAAGAQLTDADAGRTVSMRTGQTVEVVLHQASGFTPWSGVRSTDTSVLQPVVDTKATAVRGVTLAMFRAARSGQAQIQATATPDCSPGAACPAIARAYAVTVVVTD